MTQGEGEKGKGRKKGRLGRALDEGEKLSIVFLLTCGKYFEKMSKK